MAMNAAFFDAVRRNLFGGSLSQEQVNALNAIGSAWDRYGDKLGYDQFRLAYVLATAFHETGRFKHMREIWGPTAAQRRYEGRADLGNTVAGDGKKFLGRGFVQITGRRNYTDWSKRLGLDLLKEPQIAERPDIAARILVEGMVKGTFTGKKLQDYSNSDGCDFEGARRIVNGTDKAKLIANYAEHFAAALGLSANAVPVPAPVPGPIPTVPLPPPAKRGLPWGGIIIAIVIMAAIAAAFFFVTQVRF